MIDFIVIGAQKGGTSWLSDVIKAHDDAFIPERKELHFFNNPNNYNKGVDWLLEQFDGNLHKKAVGEATPNYMWCEFTEHERVNAKNAFQDVPARAHALMPHVKLLVCLRDPVKRAFSAYHHLVTHGHMAPWKPFRDVMEGAGILSMSKYAEQLECWQKYYPEDRFKVLIFEDDIRPDDKKLATANSVFRFLGLEEKQKVKNLYAVSNAREKPMMAYLRQVPGMKWRSFAWTQKPRFGDRLAYAINRGTPDIVQNMLALKISQADEDAVREILEPHTRKLETMLDRKLPW